MALFSSRYSRVIRIALATFLWDVCSAIQWLRRSSAFSSCSQSQFSAAFITGSIQLCSVFCSAIIGRSLMSISNIVVNF